MHNFHFLGGGWMMIFWGLLFVILLVVLIKAVTNRSIQSAGESPMDILKRRYASGEIGKEEFEERKKELLK
jgi:putative membrane protein